MGKKISIVEVGARDGLQNEKVVLAPEIRLEFARRLLLAGVRRLELGAFVSPKWVPQMAGSDELIRRALKEQESGRWPEEAEISALVPNPKGMADAVATGVRTVAIFGAASESFSRRNINCSIDESFERFATVMSEAKRNRMRVRGYLSTCFGCPFEGPVPHKQVVRLVKRMHELGVFEISIGDTIGVATPKDVRALLPKLIDAVGTKRLAMHFHDTRGTALANVLASLDLGIRVFDSSLGGLGGCPYAPAATGNVATEDVAYMLHGMGFVTGLDIERLVETNRWISEKVGHELPSRVGHAGLPKTKPLTKI